MGSSGSDGEGGAVRAEVGRPLSVFVVVVLLARPGVVVAAVVVVVVGGGGVVLGVVVVVIRVVREPTYL